MQVTVNEMIHGLTPGCTAFQLRDALKPDADILIRNGAICSVDIALEDGDSLVMIRRGEVPGPEELMVCMMARHTPGVHRKLRDATVGIAGLGGLGSAVAVALARIGVGRLILVDFDVVEPSNLNRQQYFLDQIGTPKTQALKSNLGRINPYVQVDLVEARIDKENIGGIFSQVDVLVEAFDAAEAKAMLVESFGAFFPKIPIVAATGLAGHAPSNTVCTRKLGRNLYVIGDLHTAAGPGTGLMAPRVGVAAHHQANAVLRLLLGEDPVG